MITPTAPVTDDQRWQVMMAKDRRYDGLFVVAVRSTRIYCRPSCPSRLPLRQNVEFYGRPEDAQQHGFRPCKRCNPDTQAFEAEIVGRVCRHIDDHVEDRLTLDNLAAVANLSPHHFQRVFKRTLGITPRQYLEARRLENLKNHLKAGESVTHALYEAGYSSSSRLYERAPDQLGMTPAVYQKGGQGMNIRYTIAPCVLGSLLVAATERGVCAVCLGDSPEIVITELHQDYPTAQFEADETGLGQWVAALLAHLEGQQPHLELPLDIQATAFQWRVWQELRAIPYGESRSYSQIAAAIGQPKAVRAVAHACASNRAAVIIPCHRVVRQGGDLGGYRWGLARKAELLNREREHAKR